jgi:hypothetical protein
MKKFSEFSREKQQVQELYDPSHDDYLYDLKNPRVLNQLNDCLGQIATRGVMSPSDMLSTIQKFLSQYGLVFTTSGLIFDWFSGVEREYRFDLSSFGGKVGFLNYISDFHTGIDNVTRIEVPKTEVWMKTTPFSPFDKHEIIINIKRDDKTRLYYFTARIQ